MSGAIVRLWWLAERKVPGFLPAERRFWLLAYRARHPLVAWAGWRKWRSRPGIGDRVRDCRGVICVVAGYGDTEDGRSASWMNCCERVAPRHPVPRGYA